MNRKCAPKARDGCIVAQQSCRSRAVVLGWVPLSSTLLNYAASAADEAVKDGFITEHLIGTLEGEPEWSEVAVECCCEGQPACNRREILPRRGRETWRRSCQGSGRVRSWLTVWLLLCHGTSRDLLRFDRVDSTHRMKQSDPAPASCVPPLPAGLLLRLAGLPELFTRDLAQRLAPADRCHPGARQTHCHRGAADPRARAGDRLPDLPWGPEPSGVVVSRRCKLAAAPAGHQLPQRRCYRGHWHRRHH
jgi:hypothetical protein